jgi:uncharacterized protein YjaZ
MDGISGYTPNGYTMNISISQEGKPWENFVGSTLAHEYNHIIRFQKRKEKDTATIAAGLAFEGLAQCFAEDITGITRPWSSALTMDEAKKIWPTIKKSLDIKDRELYDRIFTKKDDNEFPLWSGYTLSYLLIKEKIKSEGGHANWKNLIEQDSKALLGEVLQ